MPPRILHFADAHIDMANYGRHDPQTGLPMRVMDFVKSLDRIIDTAIDERVDLVLFAGDAYRDRTPAPTFQREWGRRIMRLSRAEIPTVLLVGNHDLSPALGRAHALENFDTLEVPYVRVVERPMLLKPDDLFGAPLQIIALPWISRSGMVAALNLENEDLGAIYEQLSERLQGLVDYWLEEEVDHSLPVVLAAHCSVEGATYGGERMVMIGGDLVLPGGLVRDPRFTYVALGHIHKPQDLNEGRQPPVIYPGSIERVDFGEVEDDKFFITTELIHGDTHPQWRKLGGVRPFIDRFLLLETNEDISGQLKRKLEPVEQLEGAIVRLVLEYPRIWENEINEAELREITRDCFEFSLVKRPQVENRIRLPNDEIFNSLPHPVQLDYYWRASHVPSDEAQVLNDLGASIIREVLGES